MSIDRRLRQGFERSAIVVDPDPRVTIADAVSRGKRRKRLANTARATALIVVVVLISLVGSQLLRERPRSAAGDEDPSSSTRVHGDRRYLQGEDRTAHRSSCQRHGRHLVARPRYRRGPRVVGTTRVNLSDVARILPVAGSPIPDGRAFGRRLRRHRRHLHVGAQRRSPPIHEDRRPMPGSRSTLRGAPVAGPVVDIGRAGNRGKPRDP